MLFYCTNNIKEVLNFLTSTCLGRNMYVVRFSAKTRNIFVMINSTVHIHQDTHFTIPYFNMFHSKKPTSDMIHLE
jgi:hypothetical protein